MADGGFNRGRKGVPSSQFSVLGAQFSVAGSPRLFRSARGFTLVELLIVVVLVGILAGVVIPSLGDMRTYRLREAARLLAADLEFAQSDSLAHGEQPRTVRFEPAAGRYWIAPVPPRDVPPAGAGLPPIPGEPRGTQVFAVPAGPHAADLNARTLTAALKNRFTAAGHGLSNDAIVYLEQKDQAWRVNDWSSSFLLRISGGQLIAVRDEPFLVTFGSGRGAAAAGVTIQSVSSAYANEIRFDAYGSLRQSTDAVVTLRAGNSTLTVRVAAGTGEVSIQ